MTTIGLIIRSAVTLVPSLFVGNFYVRSVGEPLSWNNITLCFGVDGLVGSVLTRSIERILFTKKDPYRCKNPEEHSTNNEIVGIIYRSFIVITDIYDTTYKYCGICNTFESVLKKHANMVYLRLYNVRDCKEITNLPNLNQLSIDRCPNIENINNIPKGEYMCISDCPLLKRIEGSSSGHIFDCRMLIQIPQSNSLSTKGIFVNNE